MFFSVKSISSSMTSSCSTTETTMIINFCVCEWRWFSLIVVRTPITIKILRITHGHFGYVVSRKKVESHECERCELAGWLVAESWLEVLLLLLRYYCRSYFISLFLAFLESLVRSQRFLPNCFRKFSYGILALDRCFFFSDIQKCRYCLFALVDCHSIYRAVWFALVLVLCCWCHVMHMQHFAVVVSWPTVWLLTLLREDTHKARSDLGNLFHDIVIIHCAWWTTFCLI